MCGRFTLTVDPSELQTTFPWLKIPDGTELTPRYNIAPTQAIAGVANNSGNTLELFRWGLIPAWAKDPKIGNRMINARAETLAEKTSFRLAFKRRRCLILADGFYEWRKDPDSTAKIPMYIQLKSGEPFAFAGLWEAWRSEDDQKILTCTIITTTPNALIEKIHNRMPVILKPEAYDHWLDPEPQEPETLSKLLKPYPASQMRAYAVSKMVNKPENDSPEVILPLK